jgi:hypothetical protein
LHQDTPAAQAEALLRRQAEIDRREGLRSALVAELHRTQVALAEVQRAQVDALNPLPQLPEMARRLRVHAAALRARLDASSTFLSTGGTSTERPAPPAAMAPVPGPLARLHQILAAAASLDDLAKIRRQVQTAAPLGLLTDDESALAQTLLHEAAARLYDRSAMAAGASPAPLLDGRDFPLQALQRALADGQACVLVVDGHNVLHLLPTLFRPHYDEQGQPAAQARRALEALLVRMGHRYPALSIRLWFDGPVMNDRAASDNVRVLFSGGVGTDRADRQIAAYLHHACAAVGNGHAAVVTADVDVASDALGNGALVIKPQDLALWFS